MNFAIILERTLQKAYLLSIILLINFVSLFEVIFLTIFQRMYKFLVCVKNLKYCFFNCLFRVEIQLTVFVRLFLSLCQDFQSIIQNVSNLSIENL